MRIEINGKTPEEIKKGLKCCSYSHPGCIDCAYRGLTFPNCMFIRSRDALAYIQQLENHIGELTEKVQQLKHGWDELFEDAKKLECERDAAVEDMNCIVRANDCIVCDFCAAKVPEECSECRCDNAGFKWRGVQEVE